MKPATEAGSQTGGQEDALIFLLSAPKLTASANPGYLRLQSRENVLEVAAATLGALAQSGLVIRNESQIVLTAAGRELAGQLNGRQSLEVVSAPILGGQEPAAAKIAVNRGESPLGALNERKSADGTRFLTQEEFEAGERLRADFTRGMLMPRVSANWHASVSAGRRTGESNGVQDLTDDALAARQRVDRALASLGRELGGVATDICCFLKGLEQVEMERRWPKRSAKFMLKAALSVLALHYWPRSNQKASTRHWGASGYRPSIGGAAR